jgi:hypothetical protein
VVGLAPPAKPPTAGVIPVAWVPVLWLPVLWLPVLWPPVIRPLGLAGVPAETALPGITVIATCVEGRAIVVPPAEGVVAAAEADRVALPGRDAASSTRSAVEEGPSAAEAEPAASAVDAAALSAAVPTPRAAVVVAAVVVAAVLGLPALRPTSGDPSGVACSGDAGATVAATFVASGWDTVWAACAAWVVIAPSLPTRGDDGLTESTAFSCGAAVVGAGGFDPDGDAALVTVADAAGRTVSVAAVLAASAPDGSAPRFSPGAALPPSGIAVAGSAEPDRVDCVAAGADSPDG